MKAIIKKINRGKLKGKFVFSLVANDQILAISKSYEQPETLSTDLIINFPDIEVIDNTEQRDSNIILIDDLN